MNGIGPRLKKIRIKFNKTQQAVAERLTMKQSQYSRIEADKSSFPVDKLCDLADLYGVSVDHLLGHEKGADSSDMFSVESQLRKAGIRYSLSDGRIKLRLLGKVFYVEPDKLDIVLAQAQKKSASLYSKVAERLIESYLCSLLMKLADDNDVDVDMD